jgi:hypothetical protein
MNYLVTMTPPIPPRYHTSHYLNFIIVILNSIIFDLTTITITLIVSSLHHQVPRNSCFLVATDLVSCS